MRGLAFSGFVEAILRGRIIIGVTAIAAVPRPESGREWTVLPLIIS